MSDCPDCGLVLPHDPKDCIAALRHEVKRAKEWGDSCFAKWAEIAAADKDRLDGSEAIRKLWFRHHPPGGVFVALGEWGVRVDAGHVTLAQSRGTDVAGALRAALAAPKADGMQR